MPADTLEELIRQRAFLRLWFAYLAGTAGKQMPMVAVGSRCQCPWLARMRLTSSAVTLPA